MPNIKSAIKRVSVNDRQKTENRGAKSALATALKKFKSLVDAEKIEEAKKILPETISIIDCSAKKGLITSQNADRKKARLALSLNKSKEVK